MKTVTKPFITLRVIALAGFAMSPFVSNAQATGALPERAIRRDIPMTNMIRNAHALGTRDSTGRPGPRYWQLKVDYNISARLDVPTHTLAGRQIVTIHNKSDSVLQIIVLRLDQNVHRPEVSRGRSVAENTDGYAITKVVVDGRQLDLNNRSAVRVSNTSGIIRLPSPIQAKSSAKLEMEWSYRIPVRSFRMGRWADSLYQFAQWYPRVAVYDDLRRGGWDTEAYLGDSEFYHNYGRFEVNLDVPAGWVVGATGVLQNPQEVLTPTARERLAQVLGSDSVVRVISANEFGPGKATASGERLIWRFVADTVNDFAWATSDRYVWDATRATIPGRGPVPVHIMYVPSNTKKFEQSAKVLRHALEFYSAMITPYEFSQLTMVDGPEPAMEYPMFIMSGLWAADHEVAHQWWPMMVGSNETWYPWMDEGFNMYMNIYSGRAFEKSPLLAPIPGQSYGTISGDENEAPLMWNANYGGRMYTLSAYMKAPLMLAMLGAIVGDSAVHQAMSEYSKAWLFKHPSPWDFMFFMNKALGKDLGWFWYYWLFTTESVNGSIKDVMTKGPQTLVTVHQEGQMPSPVILKVEFESTGAAIKRMPNSVMTDSVTALVTYPVDVWFGGSRTFIAKLNFGKRRIRSITLDPEKRFPDHNEKDNVWPAAPK